MPKITEQDVLNALSKVMDPELHKDLVSLGMIHDIVISGDNVSFTLMLTTPACPLRKQLEQSASAAVASIPGVKNVKIKMDARVPKDRRIAQQLDVPIHHVVAVASGKGGVGKSTVAVNLAVALAQSGARVGLLDADIYGPNVPTMVGLDKLPPPREKKIIPAEVFGLKVMSIGFLVKEGQPLIWRGPLLHSTIRQFLMDVDWGELDYLIVDLPPGTGDVQLSLSQTIPISGGIIVTLPQKVSLDDASRGIEMFQKLNIPIIGIIENMSYLQVENGESMHIFGKGGGKKIADKYNLPLLGQIPLASAVCEGGDNGQPIVVSAPQSSAAQVLFDISRTLAARLSVNALSEKESLK